MKFWQSIAFAEAEQLPEIAKFAEELGFYGVLNPDHIFYAEKTDSPYPYTEDGKMPQGLDFPYPDVWTSFAAMASVTTRLHFSSQVYILPLRSPIEIAKVAATVALISNNRVAIGCGIGWQKEEFDAMHVDFHTRGKRVDEMIEVMRLLWRGEVVSHHGRFFDFTNIIMRPAPTKPIPIWYGGVSAAALRRAATLCEGFISPGSTPDDLKKLIPEVNRLRREAGRDQLPYEIVGAVTDRSASPVDAVKRLADLGVTSVYAWPFNFSGLGLTSSIDEKKHVMERYARDVIQRMS